MIIIIYFAQEWGFMLLNMLDRFSLAYVVSGIALVVTSRKDNRYYLWHERLWRPITQNGHYSSFDSLSFRLINSLTWSMMNVTSRRGGGLRARHVPQMVALIDVDCMDCGAHSELLEWNLGGNVHTLVLDQIFVGATPGIVLRHSHQLEVRLNLSRKLGVASPLR